MTNPNNSEGMEISSDQQNRGTRRAFVKWFAGLGAGLGGVVWIRTRSLEDGIPWPLRRMHQANEAVSRVLFSGQRRVREFSPALAGEPRVNGTFGMLPAGSAGEIILEIPNRPGRTLSVAELISGLRRVEETTELKCIEGWSQIVTWGGVRFADVAERLGIKADQFPFVALRTADDGYYVGLDSPSAFHPQTLLCDEMNGAPLTAGHGAPLRLIIPVKYGIKNIKWIGRIQFLSSRPSDYWAERGYDWYAGL